MKKITLFITALIITLNTFSQATNWFWAKQIRGVGGDAIGNSIATDALGNVYTTGSFMGTTDFNPGVGTYNLTATGVQSDIFISKLDALGNFVWAKRLGSTGADIGYSIIVDAAGNVYTAGSFMVTVDFDPGSGIFNLSSNGGSDIFISKLNSSGNFVWAKSIGGASFNDIGCFITLDTAGNVYTTGSFYGTVDFNPGGGIFNLSSGSQLADFISKLDSSGNFVWAISMSGTGSAQGNSIVCDVAGNVYTTGYFAGTVDFDPKSGLVYNLTSAGNNDIFVSKLDASGILVWAKRFGNANNDIVSSITLDASENVYTTGAFSGTVDFNPGSGTSNLTSAGNSSVFISKLDVSGNFVWAKTMGGAGSIGNSIDIDTSGNVYTTGNFNALSDFDPGSGTFNLTPDAFKDIFISKLDSSGSFVWAKAIVGSQDDDSRSIVLDDNGSVYITGSFKSLSLPFGSTTITNNIGFKDILIAKLTSCTINPSISFTQTNLSCFGSTSGDASVTVNGGIGTYYYGWTPTGGNSANASSLSAGTYTCTISNAIGCFTTQNVIITQPQVVSFTHTQINAACYTDSNGSITIAATGGTGTYQYSKDGGSNYQSSNIFNALTAGTYQIKVKDANNCSTPNQSITITEPAYSVSFYTTKVNVVCYGGTTGSITVTASGGTGPYQYSKDGGTTYQSSNIFNGLIAGTYQIAVKDANNCTATPQNIIVTQPTSLPSFTYSTIDVACFGGNTGNITADAYDYGTYSINGGSTYQSTSDFSGLLAGTYQVVFKNNSNCISPTQSVTITQPASLPSFTFSQVNVSCNGANTGSVTVNAIGGTGPYEYSKDGGSTYQVSNVLNGLYGSTYNIRVKDANNCVTPNQSVTITQPPSAITISISNTNVSCYGNNTGSANILASGGTGILTYNWLPYGGTSAMADSLTAGTYTVTVTDSNSCVATDNAIVTEPQGLLNINTGIVKTDCGYTNGQITANVYGGTLPYHYLWSNGGTTNIIENLPASNYTLTVTDTNGCIATTPILTVGTYLPDFGLAFTAISTTGVAPFFAGFTNSTPGLSSYNFTWFWGDGTSTSSNSTNATHTYSYSGFYDVSLVATNIADGCADTLKKVGYIFLTGPTSIPQLEFVDVVSIFPNPATAKLNVNGLTKNVKIIAITNVLGENVKTLETNGDEIFEINVEGLTNGVYFIKINNRSYKFIKA
jgi:hypothetical protein